MLVVEGIICNACCFFLFKSTQKMGCLILHYREGSFSCGGSTCYIVITSSLAKLLTGSKRRDDKAGRLHEVRGYVHFLIPARFYFYQGLVHTYPNIFENGDFFSIYIFKKHESRGSVLNCFSPVQTKVQIR